MVVLVADLQLAFCHLRYERVGGEEGGGWGGWGRVGRRGRVGEGGEGGGGWEGWGGEELTNGRVLGGNLGMMLNQASKILFTSE